VSNHPLREEKDCLNCGTEVPERFCPHCGQENLPVRQSAGALFAHFVSDFLHFDGSFFRTLGQLITRPGLVPREYVRGKRKRYLDPIRMYLFTSAIFFLVFFSISGSNELKGVDGSYLSKEDRLDLALSWKKRIEMGDTAMVQPFNLLLDTSYLIEFKDSASVWDDLSYPVVIEGKKKYIIADSIRNDNSVNIGGGIFRRSSDRFREEYKRNPKEAFSKVLDKALHLFPYMLFVSLPFFALILKLLYVRRKQFFYSDHAVFTLYQYILTFILMLIFFAFQAIDDRVNVTIFSIISILVFLSGGVYLLIGMKRFYMQRWGRTLVKFLLLNIMATIVMLILLLVFLLLSFLQY
jgi:hypothetical protein